MQRSWVTSSSPSVALCQDRASNRCCRTQVHSPQSPAITNATSAWLITITFAADRWSDSKRQKRGKIADSHGRGGFPGYGDVTVDQEATSWFPTLTASVQDVA